MLENIGPDKVEQMDERILAIEAVDAKRKMLNSRGSGLPVNQITVCERIFEERCHGINIVLAHFANVLEHETEGF